MIRTPVMGIPISSPLPKRLGHYELLERFAVGDMAELFLGHARGEEGFAKLVVIKRLLPSLAADSRFVQMLQIEARIHASLSHKNIVQIHDLGMSAEGEYFIVLEYVDGRDLAALIERDAKVGRNGGPKRMSDALALFIMAEVAEGVHFAHELRAEGESPLGLVHRDISPSNILLSYAGEVKLSDFGVAKRGGDSSLVTSLKGELGYISPEQARGATVDRRSDIFSLGAVAFELCTGMPLRILTGSPDDYLKAASGIVPPATRYRPDLPPAIERLLASALAPDPRDRFPDARKFLEACREAMTSVPRPPEGEAAELRSLLARLLPPGTRIAGQDAQEVHQPGPQPLGRHHRTRLALARPRPMRASRAHRFFRSPALAPRRARARDAPGDGFRPGRPTSHARRSARGQLGAGAGAPSRRSGAGQAYPSPGLGGAPLLGPGRQRAPLLPHLRDAPARRPHLPAPRSSAGRFRAQGRPGVCRWSAGGRPHPGRGGGQARSRSARSRGAQAWLSPGSAGDALRPRGPPRGLAQAASRALASGAVR